MEKWFYNGTQMPDGKPITVCAYNEVQERDFIKKGYKPVVTEDAAASSQEDPGDGKQGDGASSPEGSSSPEGQGVDDQEDGNSSPEGNTSPQEGAQGNMTDQSSGSDAVAVKKKEELEGADLEEQGAVNE